VFICLSIITSKPEKKKKTSSKKDKPLVKDPNNLAVAVILKRLGSKRSVHSIVTRLRRRCKDLKIMERTKTSLKWLRNKFGFVRKALKKNKVNKHIRKNLFKNFFNRLFARMLKCKVVVKSKASKQIKKALKRTKKNAKLPAALSYIKTLVKLTGAEAKPKKGFFNAVRKYYKFLNRKKLVKKTIKKAGKPRNVKVNLGELKALKQKMKKHAKACIMFTGKFATKHCKKMNALNTKMRKIGKQVHKKLKKSCKKSRQYCVHKGEKKFCRKAYKVCQNVKKIEKKMAHSKRMRNAVAYGKLVAKIIKELNKK